MPNETQEEFEEMKRDALLDRVDPCEEREDLDDRELVLSLQRKWESGVYMTIDECDTLQELGGIDHLGKLLTIA